ncbi:GIY-YIG nuclease family protein [Roseovarius aquimarinus]|uniref:GIY-YIG nuclease family protein n=1 Tax=Roseovarius aquimarinus TaxID=1229156 RepID=A0ABW7I729_9RHOB
MFRFHEFLERCGLDPARTRLLRHDARGSGSWRRGPDAFLCFASIQTQANSPYRGDPSHACHFIAGPVLNGRATALFIGATEVRNRRPWDRREPPLAQDAEVLAQERSSPDALDLFDLTWCPACRPYVERILIDWGAGTRSWSQWAHGKHKDILELRLDAREEPFPGFARFHEHLSSLRFLPQSWQGALASVGGVYLLATPDGRQYVGSAYGTGGFWGRWSVYASNGHGGNRELTTLAADQRDFQVSILETASPDMSPTEIIAREAAWKEKLGARAHGLNAN